MKNREKYIDEIITMAVNGTCCRFMLDKVMPNFIDNSVNVDTLCEDGNCSACSMLFALWLDEEYTEPPKLEVDWSNVPVDTLVRVRDNKNDKWALRYFCERKENGVYMTFPNGRTSKTAKYYTKEIWKYCEELVEEADEE